MCTKNCLNKLSRYGEIIKRVVINGANLIKERFSFRGRATNAINGRKSREELCLIIRAGPCVHSEPPNQINFKFDVLALRYSFRSLVFNSVLKSALFNPIVVALPNHVPLKQLTPILAPPSAIT